MAKCPICRSNRFRRDQGTGLRFCANGHQQRTARQIEVGDDEMIGGGRQRKFRRARRAKKVVFAKGFRGATTLFLFEAFQLMLKAQVQAVIDVCGLPPLLEATVRDLWLMYVSKQGIKTSKAMKAKLAADKRKRGSGGARNKTAAAEGPVVNSILSPSYQLVFLYLGCLQLHLPVLLADVIKWADAGQIPYINALDNLPPEFLLHVSRNSLALKLFRKSPVPTMTTLRKRTQALMNLYQTMGIVFPEINSPLILLRLVKVFKIPPELYICSEIVRMVIGYVEGGSIHSNSNNKARPEILVVAYLIVAMNMCYSMDQHKRHIFISWITNLPALDSLMDNIKLQLHKERAQAMNKRTISDLDSEFRGYVDDFAVYCRDYLFDKPRLNAHKWGFQKIVEGLEEPNGSSLSSSTRQETFQKPRLRHQLEKCIDDPQTQYSTKLPKIPTSDATAADGGQGGPFRIQSIADLNDVMGEVDAHYATLIEFGSRVLIVDGKLVLKAVGAVEKGLARLVDLFELQNQMQE
ncbi:hypothetical protein BDR26DRAFT_857571 [Obelidium mucronatum]|nr:hypothetical protein BDR26DRAFT_857571 [Obelidium mucronatum]